MLAGTHIVARRRHTPMMLIRIRSPPSPIRRAVEGSGTIVHVPALFPKVAWPQFSTPEEPTEAKVSPVGNSAITDPYSARCPPKGRQYHDPFSAIRWWIIGSASLATGDTLNAPETPQRTNERGEESIACTESCCT